LRGRVATRQCKWKETGGKGTGGMGDGEGKEGRQGEGGKVGEGAD